MSEFVEALERADHRAAYAAEPAREVLDHQRQLALVRPCGNTGHGKVGGRGEGTTPVKYDTTGDNPCIIAPYMIRQANPVLFIFAYYKKACSECMPIFPIVIPI